MERWARNHWQNTKQECENARYCPRHDNASLHWLIVLRPRGGGGAPWAVVSAEEEKGLHSFCSGFFKPAIVKASSLLAPVFLPRLVDAPLMLGLAVISPGTPRGCVGAVYVQCLT